MSILSRLFGGKSSPEEKAEVYKDFRIIPDPQAEGGQFRLAARIEKEIGGAVKVHQLIRADLLQSREEAVKAAIGKAQQVIDEQGERLFG
jgi:hypothetical protein